MRKGLVFACGAAMIAGALMTAPVTATAMPLSAGAAQTELATSPLIEKVQVPRRAGAGRAVPVGRGPVRGPVGRGGRGGGIGAGGAAAIGLGILGVAAGIAAANRQPEYYEPAPVYAPRCHFERQQVYDRWGNYRGDRSVRVCD